MKRFLQYLVFVPVAAVVLLLAVANRRLVTLSLDPFNSDAPTLAFQAPLFLVLFAVLLAGVLIGGGATWIKQGRHRRNARQARAEAARHKAEVERLNAQLRAKGAAGVADEASVPVRSLPAPVPF